MLQHILVFSYRPSDSRTTRCRGYYETEHYDSALLFRRCTQGEDELVKYLADCEDDRGDGDTAWVHSLIWPEHFDAGNYSSEDNWFYAPQDRDEPDNCYQCSNVPQAIQDKVQQLLQERATQKALIHAARVKLEAEQKAAQIQKAKVEADTKAAVWEKAEYERLRAKFEKQNP